MIRARLLRIASGVILYTRPDSCWIGYEHSEDWIWIQPLPCVGVAIRKRPR